MVSSLPATRYPLHTTEPVCFIEWITYSPARTCLAHLVSAYEKRPIGGALKLGEQPDRLLPSTPVWIL